jgi:hypothetical protein
VIDRTFPFARGQGRLPPLRGSRPFRQCRDHARLRAPAKRRIAILIAPRAEGQSARPRFGDPPPMRVPRRSYPGQYQSHRRPDQRKTPAPGQCGAAKNRRASRNRYPGHALRAHHSLAPVRINIILPITTAGTRNPLVWPKFLSEVRASSHSAPQPGRTLPPPSEADPRLGDEPTEYPNEEPCCLSASARRQLPSPATRLGGEAEDQPQ